MGKNPAGEKIHGEYLCSLSAKITAENTASLFSEFIFEFKNMFKQYKFFFYNFLFAAGFFPHGENMLRLKHIIGPLIGYGIEKKNEIK